MAFNPVLPFLVLCLFMMIFSNRYYLKSFLLLSVALLLFTSGNLSADTLISPDDPAINYYGRFDYSNPKAPRFNWSGSTIEFKVSGTATVEIELTDGAGYYDIEIDGQLQSTPLHADSWGPHKYSLVNSLSSDDHVIRIIRRNEPYWAIAAFSGIYLSDGGKITPSAKPVRKMEFLGDSWTAGYFIEACGDQQAHTNTNKTWARLTSKAFRAQDIILAESGIGLLKSPGGRASLPQKYGNTFDTIGSGSTPKWDFSKWIPDIVTIFLGINDNSSGAADNEYSAAVHSFVSTIRGNYPDAYILFISYSGCMDQATRSAVAAETTTLGNKGIYFYECKQEVKGCTWHPDTTDARAISDSVVAKIKQITGWDTATVSLAHVKTISGSLEASQIKAAHIDNRTVLITSSRHRAGYPIRVVDATGKLVEQMQFDLSGVCWWNTAHIPEGFYFVGSQSSGWARVFIKR
ncbi:MAG: hypothetical protein GX556_10895 [Fibrobacter sp.]|nr:hypothetical protein [Fibrobacter sp.]